MPTIESIAERIPPLGPEALGRDAFERFVAEPQTLALAVVRDGRPVGLIERDDFLLKFASEHGHARYGERTVEHVMDADPPVFEAGLQIDAFVAPILNSGPASLLRGFIVTRDGDYWGVGTAAAMLRAASERQAADARAETERALDKARVQESELTAARGRCQFLTAMSHELRTPMNGVLAVAELLQRQPLGANAQAHVQTIVDSSETLLRILQDAVDLSRAEAGELDFAPEAVQLRNVMDTLQAEWEPRAQAQGVTLMIGYDGDTELAAEIDGRRLKQVFDNLIANALRLARGGVIEAALRAREETGSVRMEARVRDSASAPTAQASDAFTPFADGAVNGGGLGLAICRHVVQGLGGSIWAERNKGDGVTYAFDLYAPAAVIEPSTATNVAEIPDLQLNSQPHILIVDDNATNRVVAQALCEMFGCTCELAEDGQEAVEIVQGGGFDMVLMDIKMPRMDGVAATRAIRALEGPVSAIPIVALTANADPDDARRYVAEGMASVVEKPIKPERLRMAMNAALAEQGEAAATAGSRRAG